MNQIAINTHERVELLDKKTNIVYEFYVGQEPDSDQWLAFTQHPIVKDAPRFLIECESYDEAVQIGVAAHRLYYMDRANGTKNEWLQPDSDTN